MFTCYRWRHSDLLRHIGVVSERGRRGEVTSLPQVTLYLLSIDGSLYLHTLSASLRCATPKSMFYFSRFDLNDGINFSHFVLM